MTIDIDKLRNYLMDYYGTAAFSGLPMALIDLSRVQTCSAEELLQMAQRLNLDLSAFTQYS